METISKIMADELLVVSYYSQGTLCMSSLEDRNFLDHLDQKSFGEIKSKIDTIAIISWTGEYDKHRTVDRKSTPDSTFSKPERTWWQKLFGIE